MALKLRLERCGENVILNTIAVCLYPRRIKLQPVDIESNLSKKGQLRLPATEEVGIGKLCWAQTPGGT